MKEALENMGHSLARLLRFLAWYGIVVALLFYLLPLAGMFLEDRYDALSSVAKFFSIIGFFSVIVAWQVVAQRDRWRAWAQQKSLG
ncbi:MAG: hypothetical protein HKP16_04320 [Xanthomonadales bacterium]|nr:hypothetical protein [Xanthomonadales bacterium]